MGQSIPSSVLAAYGFSDDTVEPLTGGLINQTYRIRRSSGIDAVTQRLHPVFDAQVNIDIDIITRHLSRVGLVTPRLLRTLDGDRWIEHDGHVWRTLTFVPGTTIHRIEQPDSAHAAGALVGDFHRAVADLEHRYAFARAGVHDTAAHLSRLKRELTSDPTSKSPRDQLSAQARDLGADILDTAHGLPDLSTLPQRHTHGDLKISNILFAEDDLTRACCLLDLDTLGRQNLAYELGDALRSWCNPKGEDLGDAHVQPTIFEAAICGYRERVGDLLSAQEWASIIPGIETVCIELAARFCTDVFQDSYFGWDRTQFSCRREHNAVRARGQLVLARAVRKQRAALEQILAHALK